MPFGYESVDTPTRSGRTRIRKEKDPKLPNFTHPVHDNMSDTWRDLRLLSAGTRPVWANAARFLMQHPKEEPDTFERRSRMASVFNGFRRVIRASTGMVMAKPVKLGPTVSDAFRKAAGNIDGQGNHLDVFTRRLLNDGLTVGLGGILVDWPSVADAAALSAQDEHDMGLRPYFVHVMAENITMWRFAKLHGATVCTLLVLKEIREEEAGDFGVGEATYWRVFRRPVLSLDGGNGTITRQASDTITWELWKWDDRQEKPVLSVGPAVLQGAKRIPFSPFVVGDSPGTLEAEPPLLDLADLNINHYQVAADRAWVMHLACVPVPVRKGHRPERNAAGDIVEQIIGPTVMMDVSETGDFFWRSPDGTAFGPTKDELEAIERRMGALGLSFLFPENRGQETAAAKRLDKQAENASLASCVRALRDCLEGAMDIFDEYLDVPDAVDDAGESDEPSITLNTDFEQVGMDSQVAKLLSDMEAAGQLTIDTLLGALVAGKLLPEDFDVDGEVQELALKAQALANAMMPVADPNAPADGAPDSPYAAPPGDAASGAANAGDGSAPPAKTTRPAAAVPGVAAPPAAPAEHPQVTAITTTLAAVTQQLQALASTVQLLVDAEAAEPPAPPAPPQLDVTSIAALVAAIVAAMRSASPPPAFTMKRSADGTSATIAPADTEVA